MAQFRKQAGIILLTSFALRLAIAPWFHGFQYDMYIYGNWAETLVNRPLSSFYDYAESPDHLPGDLYIHCLTAHLFQLFGGENFYGSVYRFVLKSVPALFDCFLIWLAYRFVARSASRKSAIRLCTTLAFAPALVFLSAVWGQWDTVSMTIFLLGLMLLWNDRPRPILAAALFGWVLLIKPPLFLIIFPSVAGYAWVHWREQKSIGKLVASLVAMLVSATATVTALMYPFGMTWLNSWGSPSLQGQLQVAADLYPFTTLGAANIWMIPLGSLDRVSDNQTILGFTLQAIGLALMLATFAWVFLRVVRARLQPVVLIWGMATLNYGYFLLLTRSHERYLFPTIVMLAILSAFTDWRPLITRCFFASSLIYFVNLAVVYRMPSGVVGVIALESLSVANVIVFLTLLFIPLSEIGSTHHWQPAATRTTPE